MPSKKTNKPNQYKLLLLLVSMIFVSLVIGYFQPSVPSEISETEDYFIDSFYENTTINESSRILFKRNGLLYIMYDDGTNIVKFSDFETVSDFVLSPSGKEIAFVSQHLLYIMNVDGSNLRKIDNVPLTSKESSDKNRMLHPVWSHDEKRIAYEKEFLRSGKYYRNIKTNGTVESDIYNIDIHLFDYFGDGYPNYCGFAAWLPNSLDLFFSCYKSHTQTGYMMKYYGSEPIELLEANTNIPFVWSPNGEKVIVSYVVNDRILITVANVDGSNSIEIATLYSISDIMWSRDSSKILFTAGVREKQEIFVVGKNGNNITQLSNNNFIDNDPVWSPDGSKIAFSSNRDGNLEIYVMNSDGSNVRRLTFDAANDEAPQWLP